MIEFGKYNVVRIFEFSYIDFNNKSVYFIACKFMKFY